LDRGLVLLSDVFAPKVVDRSMTSPFENFVEAKSERTRCVRTPTVALLLLPRYRTFADFFVGQRQTPSDCKRVPEM
jgi:hypothetical protein